MEYTNAAAADDSSTVHSAYYGLDVLLLKEEDVRWILFSV